MDRCLGRGKDIYSRVDNKYEIYFDILRYCFLFEDVKCT